MSMKIELIGTSDLLLSDARIRINVIEIEKEVIAFFRKIRINRRSTFNQLEMLSDARKHLDNAMMFLKAEIEPERNIYIKELNDKFEHYKWYLANFGRVNKRIDTFADKIMEVVNEGEWVKKPSSPYRIKAYQGLLEECMNHLVAYPLISAYRKFQNAIFIDKDGVNLVRDKELFVYLIFLECYRATEVLGGFTREQLSGGSSAKPIGMVLGPPTIPLNARTMRSDSEQSEGTEGQTMDTSYLQDSFDVEGEENV